MPSTLDLVIKAIKRLSPAASPIHQDKAISRAELLPNLIDLERYTPASIARSTLQLPAAQRGFSEELDTYSPPLTAVLMRPSEFLRTQPPATHRSIEGPLRSLPFIAVDELPEAPYREIASNGRHRMMDQQAQYGDDPVLVNWLRGSRLEEDPIHHYLNIAAPSELSPLQIIQRDIVPAFDPEKRPLKLEPLW